MRTLTPFILLAFPLAEIAVLLELFKKYGWWVLIYLVIIGFLGLRLIHSERANIVTRVKQSLSEGENPIKLIVGTARTMLAGVLLIVPGVVSDAIAVVLLLYPTSKQNRHQHYQTSANDDVIEGEFKIVNEPTDKHLPPR